jgi:CBS domain-containing protein
LSFGTRDSKTGHQNDDESYPGLPHEGSFNLVTEDAFFENVNHFLKYMSLEKITNEKNICDRPRIDNLKIFRKEDEMKGGLVKDWMTKDPIIVDSNISMPDAYWKMVKNNIRRLLVIDDGVLVGVVTIDDLTQKIPWTTFALNAAHTSEFLSKLPVRMVMSHNLITTTTETTLLDAAELMLSNEISTLPVLHNKLVVGIITERDIFRAFVSLASEE